MVQLAPGFTKSKVLVRVAIVAEAFGPDDHVVLDNLSLAAQKPQRVQLVTQHCSRRKQGGRREAAIAVSSLHTRYSSGPAMYVLPSGGLVGAQSKTSKWPFASGRCRARGA